MNNPTSVYTEKQPKKKNIAREKGRKDYFQKKILVMHSHDNNGTEIKVHSIGLTLNSSQYFVVFCNEISNGHYAVEGGEG